MMMKLLYLPLAAFILLFITSCEDVPQLPVTATVTSTSISTSTATKTAVSIERDCSKILKGIESTCPKAGSVQAVDISEPATQRFLDVAWCLGARALIRYGDYDGQTVDGKKLYETIKGKIPKAAERKLTQSNGFAEAFVFQHNNRWADRNGNLFNTFRALRGEADAERMNQLFPEVPVWYYGVDFDAESSHMPKVKEYAIAFKKVADKYKKKVGVYGGGRALSMLKEAGLAEYFWISMSTGFDGTADFTASKKWHLLQKINKMCGGIDADFDIVNPSFTSFGQIL